MSIIEAIILGIIQGLTEFLPISSSGHIELGKVLLGIHTDHDLLFSLLVHGATVLAILIVFWQDIKTIFKGLLSGDKMQIRYFLFLLASSVPLLILGLFFRNEIAQLFDGNLRLVGSMLLVTAVLLQLSRLEKKENRKLSIGSSLLIGLSQAIAVLPGISRSGATICTGLALGLSREEAARFSFLMVLIPILGANFLQLIQIEQLQVGTTNWMPLICGTIAAFVSGLFACRWMLALVKRGKIIHFSIYCVVIGLVAIGLSFR